MIKLAEVIDSYLSILTMSVVPRSWKPRPRGVHQQRVGIRVRVREGGGVVTLAK